MREHKTRSVLTPDEDLWSAALRVTLEDTSVSAVMSRTFPRASARTNVSDLEWLFCYQDVCSVPVVGPADRLLGIVTKSDLIRGRADEELSIDDSEPNIQPRLPGDDEAAERIGLHLDTEDGELLVGDVMTPALVVAQQQTAIGHAMTLMVYEGVSSLPVVRRSGRDDRIVGMVSTRDIVHWMAERAGYLGELARGGLQFAEWDAGPPPQPLPTCETCSPRCADC